MMKLLSILLLILASAVAWAQPSQVIVVRHAERPPESDTAPLTADGLMRAEALADLLMSANVQAIVTTHLRRTQDTAAPLAKRLGITPIVIPYRAGAGHVAEVVDTVRKLSGVVLVVGHTYTMGGIVSQLTLGTAPATCDTSFGNLFVVTPGAAPALLLKYGKADPMPALGCQ